MPTAERYTVDQVATALKLAGGLRTHAARQLGCALSTIANYVNRHPELAEVEREILEANLDFCENQLLVNIKEGKEQSLFFFLRCKGSHRGFVEKKIVEQTGPGGGPIQTVEVQKIDFSDLTQEERDVVRGILSRRTSQP